jgi:hypothetical protein
LVVSRQSAGQKTKGKDTHTINKDNVVAIKKPERFVDDPISDILRQGARDLLAHALEAEIEIFLNQYKDLRDETGLQRIVRNGYLPERQIQNGNRTGACGSSPDKGSVFAGSGKGILPFSYIAALPAEDQEHGTIDSVAVFERCSHIEFSYRIMHGHLTPLKKNFSPRGCFTALCQRV